MTPKAKLVYSSGEGRRCGRCGWPADACRCATSGQDREQVPARPIAKLRIEKKGRGGKTVTLVEGLPRNEAFLVALATELKKACGTGGGRTEDAIELQGDQRERLRAVLGARGFVVRG